MHYKLPITNYQFPRKILVGIFLTVGYLLLATPAQAQLTTDLEQSITSLNFFQSQLGVFITRIVETALIIGSILVLTYLIWGGIEWTTSGGDKSKYEEARNKITAALIGVAILSSAFALWTLANYFFGIDKKINTGGIGSGAAATSNSECWPFTSCSAWEAEFSRLHGRMPTSQDKTDFSASQDFLRQTGRSPSDNDWQCRYNNKGNWCL